MARLKIDLPDTLPFTTDLDVRITDINYGQHLANHALLGLLHETRLRFLRHHGFTEKESGGAGIIMVDTALVFKGEIFHGTTLRIEVGVTEPHKLGCDFVYRVVHQETGREVARAKTGIVFFDYAARKMSPMPEAFRDRLFPTPG